MSDVEDQRFPTADTGGGRYIWIENAQRPFDPQQSSPNDIADEDARTLPEIGILYKQHPPYNVAEHNDTDSRKRMTLTIASCLEGPLFLAKQKAAFRMRAV